AQDEHLEAEIVGWLLPAGGGEGEGGAMEGEGRVVRAVTGESAADGEVDVEVDRIGEQHVEQRLEAADGVVGVGGVKRRGEGGGLLVGGVECGGARQHGGEALDIALFAQEQGGVEGEAAADGGGQRGAPEQRVVLLEAL